MRRRFENRRALVTGGASGIGRACGQALVGEGAAVVLLDRDDAVHAAGGEMGAHAVLCDVTDEAAVCAAIEEAEAMLGGCPDILVASAGVYRVAPALEVSAAAWDDVLAINLTGSFLVAREVALRLAAGSAPGAVVLLSSTAGLRGDAAEPAVAYAATKTALVGLVRQLAAEWAPLGVRVNAVCPGVIDTPMLRLMDDPVDGAEYLSTRVPLRRLGETAEVADAVLFLASDEASYITGVALPVDGGVTAI